MPASFFPTGRCSGRTRKSASMATGCFRRWAVLRVFIGFRDRPAVSYHVLCASIMKHASKPVAIIPLVLPTLPMQRRGLTPFTFSRFICPYLCGFHGKSVFLDADIMLRADITELFSYTG